MQVEEKIAVTMDEYKHLIEVGVRAKVLEDYIKTERYSPDKDLIRAIMGFAPDVTDDV